MNTTDERLFEQAQELRAEAHALLFQDELLATIQQTRPAIVCGSFVLDVMTWRDLDFNVRLVDDSEISAFLDIGVAIARRFQVLKASYENFLTRKVPGLDHGLYWGIQLEHKMQRWNLDLWGYGPVRFAEHRANSEQLQEALQGSDRATILRIKDVICREEGYCRETFSVDIYTAVLQAGVKTTQQFRDWCSCRATEKR
jgi:hypothetical protein